MTVFDAAGRRDGVTLVSHYCDGYDVLFVGAADPDQVPGGVYACGHVPPDVGRAGK